MYREAAGTCFPQILDSLALQAGQTGAGHNPECHEKIKIVQKINISQEVESSE